MLVRIEARAAGIEGSELSSASYQRPLMADRRLERALEHYPPEALSGAAGSLTGQLPGFATPQSSGTSLWLRAVSGRMLNMRAAGGLQTHLHSPCSIHANSARRAALVGPLTPRRAKTRKTC